ncbi:type II secretion system protein [Acetivibrio mesophilus]|uniref:Type II secretion system protein n=1 Tax=Acetivibrio mesophilus TaxID=2487273 RepID=A0A4Q0I6J2_9FIRM|nr:type II secretion system protein [Acetivibrio mesophilus]RXE59940.1 type II secretion system protein [Acetivibrio mesophilus]HHV29475.1 type II secretion system protein [Clostridium sp.]
MKKMLKNQKGFSLVELLIVIAIMGVLAAVAFSMFAGVLGNSKRRADERTADQIAKAITAYMVDTGDIDLSEIRDDGSDEVESVIEGLQEEIWLDSTGEKATEGAEGAKKYGPYLTPKDGSDPSYEAYAPQWDKHKGYYIKYFKDLMKADVEPVEEGGSLEVKVEEGT